MMKKTLLLLLTCTLGALISHAQISGTVYRDFNGNGIQDNNETGVGDILINAYNSSNSLLTSTTAASNGTYSMPYTVPVRVEFVIPNNSCLNTSMDFTGFALEGNNVRFLNAANTSLNYGILNPQEYTSNINPMVYVPKYIAGDPLAGGTAATSTGLWGYQYNSAGTQTGSLSLPTASIGSLWGMTYSKQAKKIFGAAFIKRQVGLGPMGSGGIYMIEPTSTSYNVTQFYDLDANGHRTRANNTAPSYGQGSSYSVSGGTTITYLGGNDPESGFPKGLGVVGDNATERLLPAAAAADCYDPAAFDQVGKVGLGDIEISDDGKFLFVMNLYSRKLIRMELNDAYNPTSVVNVTEYNVPSVVATNGEYRPFAVAFQREKVYIGMITSGENGGTNTINGATDLYAYVFEMNNPTGAASFNTTPVLTFPLNYQKGYAIQTLNGNPEAMKWHGWSNNTANVVSDGFEFSWSSPILSNIDFTDRGDMILDFCDRGGHQYGYQNYKNLDAVGGLASSAYDVSGDILIAGKNCATGGWTIETAGSYNSNGSTFSSTGTANANGPGGGEFYNQDIPPDNYHNETSQGAVAMVRGSNQGIFTLMDANSAFSGGTGRFSSADGSATNRLNLYQNEDGSFSKANGLGDIEVAAEESPTELGNRVWLDDNKNGIQDAGENGIQNVTVELFCDTDNDGVSDGAAIAAITTDPDGYWYFNNSNVTDGDCITAGNQTGLQPNKQYIVKIGSADWTSGAGTGDLNLLILTIPNATVTGIIDASDNDATLVSTIPQIVMNTTKLGENNHSYDFGFSTLPPFGSIGNYVWIDDNANGLNDEPATAGINGVKVYLYDNTNPSTAIDSVLTSNDGANPGYYLFDSLSSGTYFVKFPTTTGTDNLTTQTTTAQTDNNSDANTSTGNSPLVVIDVMGSGQDKDNTTIDAGYYELASLGNYVWNDLNHDGDQNTNEVGVAGISVTLYDDLGNPISTTLTDAYGYYLFDNLIPAYYTVGFTLPQNYVFTVTSGTSETDAINSDVDVTTGNTTSIILSSGEHQMNIDAGIYFQPQNTATVGNYVWFDTNADGIQDANEVGISGVTVTLYNNANEPVATTITDANGQYLFTNVTPGTYSVGFTSPVGMILSSNNGGVSTSDNSDASPLTGMTGTFVVNAGDNITYVDAGFTPQPSTTASLGDKVWYDVNQNGVQDNGELGVEGVTVTLFQSNGTSIIAATVTDAYGNYIFNNLAAGQYVVGFTNLPIDYVLTSTTGVNATTNSDANTTTAKTAIIDLSAGEHDMTWDAGIFNNVATNNNSIGDYVWNDVDKDGIQDANEQGVAGVTVTLYNNLNVPISTTSTNANGQYTFPDLPNGTYTVGFSNLPEGFVFSPIGAGNTSTDSDPNPSTGLTASVSLTGNTHITTLDAGINLGNPNVGTASLGDLVWYDINNNGLQDAGEAGVQNVTATLYASNGTTVLATTTTNALGYYVFTGLNAGDYVVGFTNLPVGFTITSKDANAQGIEGETNSDVNIATNKTDVISLALGQDKMSVDMGIVPPSGSAALGDLVWYDLNNDGLQTSGEPGVQGVTVTLYDNTNTAISTTTTDANGEYHFVGLTPATYSVGFSNLPTGYTFTTASGVINDATNSDANVTTGMTATVTLAAGDNNLNLDAGIVSSTVASVGDYVWYDINHDGIQDANEPGLGGILVTLYDNTNTPVASTITNPDGSYIFTNVTPGDYTMGFENLPTGMTFTAQETNPASNTGSNVNPSTGLTPSFTVVAGTHNPTIDAGLTTSPLAGLGNYVWFDNNRDGVQGATETGVAGAIATLYASNGTTVLAQAITDGNGAYSFTNLDAGDYIVGFSNLPLGYVATQSNGALNVATNSDMNPTTGKTTTATLAAGEYNPNLDAGIMKPIAHLGNYVWNDINKDGIQDNTEVGVAGITVTLFNNTNTVISTTITDAYGYYKFSPLEEGTYHVGFTLPANYVFTLQDATADAVDADVNPTTGITGDYVIVAGDSNMTVDAGIYFQQPATASVGNYVWLDVNQDGIQDGTEHGISGVTVTLCSSTGTVIATTITDVNGYYLFSNVTPGNYAVGFTSPVGLVASPSNGITSDVNNSDANPLTGKTNVFTLSSGENITYVDAGFYSQSALLGGLGDKVWYDVNQDGVQNNGEIGVQGVTITLYQADGTTTISTTTTDAYGNYIFNNLPQGQYVVGFTNLPIDYVLTTTTGTDSTSNSDANVGTGKTPIINLAQGQFNLTYDAGIYTTNSSNTNSIGDLVWFDLNKDGIQTSNESGAPGVTVTLYDNTNTIISVTSTNSDGAYLFPDLPNGTYYVGFSNLPVGYGFSQTGQGTTSTDSDPNTNTGLTSTVTLTGNTHIIDLDAGIGKGNDPRIGKATLGDLVWYDLNNNGLQDNGESGVAGVFVTLYQGDGITTIKTTTTDALGNYIFTNLDAGSFVVGFTNLPVGYTISPKNADVTGIEGELNSDVDNTTQKTDIISLATGEDKLSVDMGIAPPIGTASLGNLVWFDLNFDGLQTNGEPGVQGVSVTLYDNANTAVATTTTNALGEYYFIGLTPGTYSVGFDNIPSGYILTTQNADATGINGALNSDANATTGLTSTVTLASGDNNLNLDAGINSTTVASVGDYVWLDVNQNGIQDPSENGVGGVLVTLYNNLGTSIASTITSPNGSYIFTNVVPGDYTIGFANLPLGTVFTIQETNPTSNTGSNVNPTTGFTPTFNVVAGTHNPTIDAGLTSDILSSLGNYVWHDFNEDGLQNATEPGVPGVLVTLYAADGTTVLANASTNGNGGYIFTNLLAGDYVVGFSNLPIGSTRTKNVGASVNEPANSDMNVNGKTSVVTLGAGEFNPYVDAGIYFGIPLGANKLIATTAVIEDVKTCKVNWYTVEETNTKDFIIERSIDGTNFVATGTSNASYQTVGNTNYTFNDDISAIANARIIYYRIKLRDLDDKLMTSNVILVKQNNNTHDLMVYPAPFTEVIMMDYIATEATSIEAVLTDALGNVVMKVTKDIDKGLNTISFPNLSHLATGSYFVKFVDINTNTKMVRKIVK